MNKHLPLFRVLIEKIKEPLLAILAALLISSFIMSHTEVPTESMKPTISPGDHLIVNRLPYYYRNPKRGEIVVFNYKGENLIKRIIGVSGDTIEILDGKVYVNGKRLDESIYLGEHEETFTFSKSPITFPYKVPEGNYFVLGDNRRNSSDSRVIGPISGSCIMAKAGYRIYPMGDIGLVR